MKEIIGTKSGKGQAAEFKEHGLNEGAKRQK
jgi:hypothetical protein